jgi:hypothetical protein
MATAREENHRLVAAPSRFRDRPRLRSEPLRDPEWVGFCQPDLDVATEGAEPAACSFLVSEIGVEEWYSVDSSIRNAQVTRLRVNPVERKGLELGLGT